VSVNMYVSVYVRVCDWGGLGECVYVCVCA